MTVEWLDGDGVDDADELPQPPPVGPGRKRAIWIGLVAVAIALAVGIAVTQSGGSGRPKAAPSTSLSSNAPSSASSSLPGSSPQLSSPVTTPVTARLPRVVEIGHRVLGATSNWQLVLYGDGTLIRIEMAAGLLHRTPTPQVLSGGGVNFVVGSSTAVLRPFDAVDGYVVRDGQPARVLRGLLADGGAGIFAGPTADHVWVQPSTDGANTPPPRLLDLRTQQTIGTGPAAPPGLGQPFMSDQAGYLLYGGVGGVYDVRPEGVHRVTTGAIAAAGAHFLLAQECDEQFRCVMVLIDQRTGARRQLASSQTSLGFLAGSISPDARYAAYATISGAGQPQAHLIDLTSGADTALGLMLSENAFGSMPFVWDPDNDNLITLDNGQALRVIDPVTHRVSSLGIDLPPIDELGMRPATD
jgi:hypothetical protein